MFAKSVGIVLFFVGFLSASIGLMLILAATANEGVMSREMYQADWSNGVVGLLGGLQLLGIGLLLATVAGQSRRDA